MAVRGAMIVLLALSVTTAFQMNWFFVTASAARTEGSANEGRVFAIQRNGEDIGRHEVRFERVDGRLNVRINVSVDYRILFIPVYRFRHEAHEIWDGGALKALQATTDDNGESFDVAVKSQGEVLTLHVNGEETDIETSVVPSSLWRQVMARTGQMIDPADGEVMQVEVEGGEWREILVRGETIRARHYVMTGGLERELWYDSKGLLVKVQFAGEDGSDLQFRLL